MDVKQLRPLGERLIVEVEEVTNKTAGGIILTKNETRQAKGVVVAVSEGWYANDGRLHSLDSSVGDTVLFDRYKGVVIDDLGDKYRLINESDVFCILDSK